MGSQSMAAGFPFVAVAARIRAQASYAGLVVLILAGCGMALLLIHESQLWRATITEESRYDRPSLPSLMHEFQLPGQG